MQVIYRRFTYDYNQVNIEKNICQSRAINRHYQMPGMAESHNLNEAIGITRQPCVSDCRYQLATSL